MSAASLLMHEATCRTLLNRDPEKRPTAQEALNHPWLQGDVSDRHKGKPLSFQVPPPPPPRHNYTQHTSSRKCHLCGVPYCLVYQTFSVYHPPKGDKVVEWAIICNPRHDTELRMILLVCMQVVQRVQRYGRNCLLRRSLLSLMVSELMHDNDSASTPEEPGNHSQQKNAAAGVQARTQSRSYEYDDKGRPLMDSPNARAMMSVLKRLNVRGKTEVSRADLAKVHTPDVFLGHLCCCSIQKCFGMYVSKT